VSLSQFSIPAISTPRLVLTWPNETQIKQYYDDIVGSDMFDTILWDGPQEQEDLHNYWKANREIDPADYSSATSFSVIEKASNKYIGGVSLRPVNNNKHIIDIGYAFAPMYQGKGFATEAVKYSIHHSFNHRQAERVFATIFTFNPESKNVAIKAQMKLEGTMKRCVQKQNKWCDEWLMAITRTDWAENPLYQSI
jgi:RimJ/RimL family protein N-acetyltransferase